MRGYVTQCDRIAGSPLYAPGPNDVRPLGREPERAIIQIEIDRYVAAEVEIMERGGPVYVYAADLEAEIARLRAALEEVRAAECCGCSVYARIVDRVLGEVDGETPATDPIDLSIKPADCTCVPVIGFGKTVTGLVRDFACPKHGDTR